MTVRIVGAVLCGAAALYTGGALCEQWERRVRTLRGFCRLVSALEVGIGEMGLPLSQLFSGFGEEELERCGFLPDVRARYANGGAAGLAAEAYAACGVSVCLEREESALLTSFFEILGTEDREHTRGRCAYVRGMLEQLHTEAAAALPTRCRVARTLSASAGGVVLLLLL